MKKNEIKEILALGEKAISGKIIELKKEIAKNSLEMTRGKIKNVRANRSLKRAIAVLKSSVQGVK